MIIFIILAKTKFNIVSIRYFVTDVFCISSRRALARSIHKAIESFNFVTDN